MTVQGWKVFSTVATNAATAASTVTTDTWTINGTAPYTMPVYVPAYEPTQIREATARPEEPLDWLRRRVDEMCNLGRLD